MINAAPFVSDLQNAEAACLRRDTKRADPSWPGPHLAFAFSERQNCGICSDWILLTAVVARLNFDLVLKEGLGKGAVLARCWGSH
jgi:hypothetical protein